ncbi:MAG: molecular chaperone TorD family protein [Rhodocyclaceae bacterium]|nr:molecular chaperone TorD family protein [Rhodocyclaceae bacterium]
MSAPADAVSDLRGEPADAVSPAPTFFRLVGEVIAEDAESLAALHDRELTPDLLAALHDAKFPACLGLMPATSAVAAAWRTMADGLASLSAAPDAAVFDDLAVEYAAIYLTGAYGASPCESVWTDDDHLVCQDAMFQLRDIYAAAGLAATDWRHRPDDHLVLQLLYVAHAARATTTRAQMRNLADMLDMHLLRWLPGFAARVAARSSSQFYAGLAVLTVAWLDTLRDLLVVQLGEPRPSRAAIEERLHPRREIETEAVPMQFIPGTAGPSW